MEKGKLKLFAAALVMTMLCSVAIVAIDAGDDIDGANKTVDYQFNLQLNNGTDKLVDDLAKGKPIEKILSV